MSFHPELERLLYGIMNLRTHFLYFFQISLLRSDDIWFVLFYSSVKQSHMIVDLVLGDWRERFYYVPFWGIQRLCLVAACLAEAAITFYAVLVQYL